MDAYWLEETESSTTIADFAFTQDFGLVILIILLCR